MNKTDLVGGVLADADISRAAAERVVNGIFDRMADALKAGDDIVLQNFCTLKVHHKPATVGRNVRTGQTMDIPAKKVVRFKAGRGLKAAVAGTA